MALNDRIILGIDPGTLVMGYGILHIENNRLKPLGIGVVKLDKPLPLLKNISPTS
jgi:crossover junction endodeoxyribonuclease RuvC